MRITCPFCGLACDDLVLGADGSVDARGCPKGAAGFARATSGGAHEVEGRPATLEEAAGAAARLLGAARQPLVAGLGADLDGIRACLALADRIGAIVDHQHGAPLLRNLAEVQSTGWMTATFSEVANRADVVLVLGRDPTPVFPRFFERLVRNPDALYRAGPPALCYLGDPSAVPMGETISARLAVAPDALLDAVAALNALLAGHPVREEALGGLALADLAALADRLKAARYSVIVWDAGGLSDASGGLVIDAVLRLIRRLNVKTRCVGLPLGGNDNAQGALQAMLWQAGWPTRLAFTPEGPAHDPWRCDWRRLLAAGEVDALLWVSALSPVAPPSTNVPTIALVSGDTALATPPAVAIRVGCPAIDHDGTAMRADTVVALPLAAVRRSAALRVSDAADAILNKLGGAA